MFGYSIVRQAQSRPYFTALFDDLAAFAVPLEGLHTETGPGVFEAAILHVAGLESADRAVLFKTAVKEIAQRFGVMPTFMARWSRELPGCGGHIVGHDGRKVGGGVAALADQCRRPAAAGFLYIQGAVHPCARHGDEQ